MSFHGGADYALFSRAMLSVRAHAQARVGLLGNPSDLYGGQGVAFTFDAFSARVELSASDGIRLAGDAATSSPQRQ